MSHLVLRTEQARRADAQGRPVYGSHVGMSDLILSEKLTLWCLMLKLVLSIPVLMVLVPGVTLVPCPWMSFACMQLVSIG